MNNDEILLIQNYLRDIFDNEEISIRKEQEVPPIAKFFLGKEAIGFLKKDDDSDEDDISYSLTVFVESDINNSEDLQNKIQSISKKKRIIISDRGAIEDSKEVSIITVDNEEEFLGIIFEDNEASCIFSMSILDFDL
ncbi:MAG: hypothetical protein CML97_06570 [Rhodobiaceae bacterium]|nr:hypothetical protein [Rhodobiaceae bacterium]MBJ66135.1 hypothetical protein [Rhodobiaceae bacterium]|tara:strand:+ start:3835 stop:4245 length:411 start_codon:yes stop_codon:yes gene_type:complete